MKATEELYKKWVENTSLDDETKEYLMEQSGSYMSWLVFFLKNTVKKE